MSDHTQYIAGDYRCDLSRDTIIRPTTVRWGRKA